MRIDARGLHYRDLNEKIIKPQIVETKNLSWIMSTVSATSETDSQEIISRLLSTVQQETT